EVIQGLRQVYTSTLGHDWDHVHHPAEREWLKEAAETRRFHPDTLLMDGRALLERLTEIETLELFLHRTFPGKYRFSIEGLDMLVPMLDVMIDGAAADNYKDVSIGMAHRGRLNVMAHILNKPYQDILAEFKDAVISNNNKLEDQFGYLGDVKYHKSMAHEVASLRVRMPANPSHLEAVNAVAVGMARAAESLVNRGGAPEFNHHQALTVLIHGDAAFTGQGSVAETLNMANLPGYRTGGTLHIIANNQIGFTTLPSDSRSTNYASDPAKGYDIPILHVNADDPEACIEAARFAYAYHREFQKDFVIDLIGYRRYGHNELDEPEYTQPMIYEKVKNHARVRQVWANTLLKRQQIDEGEPEALVKEHEQNLQYLYESLTDEDLIPKALPFAAPPGRASQVVTGVRAEQLIEINEALGQYPDSFHVHRKLSRTLKARRDALHSDEPAIDWSAAEELAFATILADGVPIRFTGQDVERGTFSQRHAVLHDSITGERFVPLQAFPQARAAFEIYNSPLSENAALAFEYGYNVQSPNRLVIWEAQFGDFINNAQVVIDEFITSANAKWNQTVSLVLLLPHGNEGKGPDHSSARLERFLQLAAKKNMRIAYCTRAAQYFHLLRRQAL
ncbi:MAG: 2-oxoglutarate dehydrogenase E1 component, partial [Anaerolineae bacterium]|nr:2-oxoglutarate dehydrogenase E1 component [Anaerolineae bacterium]